MRNRFPGTCYRCGENVSSGAGKFAYENFPGSRWPQLRMQRNHALVEHDRCADKYRGTNIHYLYEPDEAENFEVIEPDEKSRYR